VTVAEYETRLDGIRGKLVEVEALRQQLKEKRRREVSGKTVEQILTEAPAVASTAVSVTPLSMEVASKQPYEPTATIGLPKTEFVQTTGKPEELAPAASTAIRDVRPMETPGQTSIGPREGDITPFKEKAKAFATGLTHEVTLGAFDLTPNEIKLLQEHPEAGVLGSLAGAVAPMATSVGTTSTGVKGAIKIATKIFPSLGESTVGKNVVVKILGRLGTELAAGGGYGAARKEVSGEGDWGDVGETATMFTAPGMVYQGAKAILDESEPQDMTRLVPVIMGALSAVGIKKEIQQRLARGGARGTEMAARSEETHPLGGVQSEVATPKEVLKEVTPLEEVAAAKERAIAGEPAPERGTNVLIEAEREVAPAEQRAQHAAPLREEVPAAVKPKRARKPKTNEEIVVDLEKMTEEDLNRKPGEQPKEVDFEGAMQDAWQTPEPRLVKKEVGPTVAATVPARAEVAISGNPADVVAARTAAVETTFPKQPWGMTLTEFRAASKKASDLNFQERNQLNVIDKRVHSHLVEKALEEGKPVPAEVLADYPDLAAKYGKVAAKAAPTEVTKYYRLKDENGNLTGSYAAIRKPPEGYHPENPDHVWITTEHPTHSMYAGGAGEIDPARLVPFANTAKDLRLAKELTEGRNARMRGSKEMADSYRAAGLGITDKPERPTVTERLTMAETDAKIRIRKRVKNGKVFDIVAATAEAVANTADLVIIGAAKMAKGAIEFKEWVVEMLREKPDLKEDHLKQIYEKAKEQFHRVRARDIVKEHIDYYNNISAPPEMRPREYSMLKDLKEQVKAEVKGKQPKGKEARKRIHDLAWQEMLGELWQEGVPMQKLESGELVPLVNLGKPAKEFMGEMIADAEKQFSKEQLKDPAVKRQINEQAREMFVLAAQSRGIATKIKGQQKLRPEIRRKSELSLRLMTETVMTPEERVRLRRLNKVDPDKAIDEYQMIAKQRGIILPGIRQSGTYVPDEALFYKHFKDAEAGPLGGTKEFFRLMEEIDGALPAEVKAALPGGAGPISKGVLWANHDMLRQKMEFLYAEEASLKQIRGKLSDKDLIFANRVLERIGKDQGNVSLDNLMTDSRFYEVVTAYKPIAEAIEKARTAGQDLSTQAVARIVEEKVGNIVRYAQKMRGWYDELILDFINPVRRARSQKEIPYHDYYSPHELQQEVFWSKAKHFIEGKVTGKGEAEVTLPPMPEFIQPNKPFNPRELPRNAGLEEYEREMNSGTLAEHYLDLAAKDIFHTSIIQNAKAYADFLDARGFPNAARAIQEYTSEVYAGTPNWLDKRVPKAIIKSLGVYKGGLIRSVFPLNAPWIAVMQTANVVNTTMWHGYLNSAQGLLDWVTKPKWRQEVLDNAYSYMIKSERGGRAAYQDFDKAMASAARLERSKLEKAQDAFNYFSEQVEKGMTGFAISAGYRDGAKRGLTGKALWEFASEAGERAQNLFNNEDVPGILRSKTVKGVAPFQTFTFGMFNTMREIAGKTGTPPATAAERMRIALRFVAGATALNYAWSTINQKQPWDISSWVPFYGVVFGPLVEAAKGEDWKSASSRGLPSPVATGAEFVKALSDGIGKGKWTPLRKWLMKYATGLVGIPGGTQMNRIWDGVEAIAKGGVEDASGKMVFPVSGTKESVRAIWNGPYGTDAGQEYLQKREKGIDTGVQNKKVVRAFRAFPVGGELLRPQKAAKTPAQERTRLRKEIFEGAKGKTKPTASGGAPEVDKDLESDVEKFMWNGGEWKDLQKSLEDRYATDEEIDAVSAMWEKVSESIDRAGLTDQLYDRVTAIKDKEQSEKDAEKKAKEEERDKRTKAFQVKKAG